MYLVPFTRRAIDPMEQLLSPWERGIFENMPLPGIPEMHLGASMWDPPVDFVEGKDSYVLLLDAPGMKKEDIDIEFTDGILYIRGERKHEQEVGDGLALLLERRCGSFSRHFHLRSDIASDKIRADYSDGILKVTVPKGSKSVSKSIPINVS